MNRLAYKKGYKFQVHDAYQIETGISGHAVALGRHLSLSPTGTLVIGPGYAWDGASGPAINTINFLRASLVHDALYQLIREDKLPFSFRKRADEILIEICKEDGMSWVRRQWVWYAVRLGGALAVESANPVLFAPEKP